MKFNRILYSIKVNLVIALFFVLFSVGLMPAIAQDSSQTPPYGYDQGVWVLTDKTSTIEQSESSTGQYGYFHTLSVRENSVTGSTSWRDSDCSGQYTQTNTWTTPPSVLTPGTKQEITTTAKVGGGQDCGGRHAGTWMSVWVPQSLSPCASISWYSADPIPPQVTETATWEVGWGKKIGDTMTIEINPHVSAIAKGGIFYTYTYQASVPKSVPTPDENIADTKANIGIPTEPAPASEENLALKPGSIWKVKEYGPMGNWDGEWIIREDGQTIDASWSGGSITDTIDIKSIDGDQVTLYRHGNRGYYTGTISPDGLSISGTASWYSTGETWTASTT